MTTVTTIGIDLAKNSFSVYGVGSKGKPVLSRALNRAGVVRFFANLPSCLVGMEACAPSEYWARTIESLGHEVRRIHPRYVKAYLYSPAVSWYGSVTNRSGSSVPVLTIDS